MKRNLNMLFALAIAATLVIVTADTAYARSCTDATLNATYGFTSSGFDLTPEHAPFAVLGTMRFDGAGKFSFGPHLTLVINGSVSTEDTGAGTYTVNSDCTGSISLTSGSICCLTFNLSIVADGAEVLGILTSPGVNTSTFDAKKQRREPSRSN